MGKEPLLRQVSMSELHALRDMGYTYREIAKQLGVSIPTVCKHLKGYVRKPPKETHGERVRLKGADTFREDT